MRLKDYVWLWKEGAVVGLIVGALMYFFRDRIPLIINQISAWWGPFTESQLLFVLLYLGVTIGIIFDAIYEPKK